MGIYVTKEMALEEISNQLLEKVQKDSLQQSINDRVKWQTRLTARFVPLPIKYHAIRYGYRSFSERTKAITLTNMGKVQLPDSMKSHISHMEMVMYPTKKSPINVGILAVGDEFVITFARMIQETLSDPSFESFPQHIIWRLKYTPMTVGAYYATTLFQIQCQYKAAILPVMRI